jgi:hypothetical protein
MLPPLTPPTALSQTALRTAPDSVGKMDQRILGRRDKQYYVGGTGRPWSTRRPVDFSN